MCLTHYGANESVIATKQYYAASATTISCEMKLYIEQQAAYLNLPGISIYNFLMLQTGVVNIEASLPQLRNTQT